MVGNAIQIKRGIIINFGAIVKNIMHHKCEKDYIWNPAICPCKNGECLASAIDNSVIMCDKL